MKCNARIPYVRVYIIPWHGDSRWPQYPALSDREMVEIFKENIAKKRTIGFSHDDAGLAIVAQSGEQGQNMVELWGFPNNADLRNAYLSFYKTHYPQTIVRFVEIGNSPIPAPPPPTSPTPIGVHPAIPALPFKQRLGIHTLNRFEEVTEAWSFGCRSFTIMDNLFAARWARSKNSAVIVRAYFEQGVIPTPDQYLEKLGVGDSDALIIMGLNEDEAFNANDIEERFKWDKWFCETVWRRYPRCFPVVGNWSMGTPQIDKPEIAKRFKEVYSQFLNANAHRCGINYHAYHRRSIESLPPSDEPVIAPRWLASRFVEFGYRPSACDLSPSVIMVADEYGVDIPGKGGFSAIGYTAEQFRVWLALHRALFEAKSQIYTTNLFQLSPSERWAGYNLRPYLAELSRFWQ